MSMKSEISAVEQINVILDLSGQMLDAAGEHDWEQVFAMENNRRLLLDGLFEAAIPDSEAAQIEAGIQKILEMDGELLKLGRADKQDFEQEIRSFNLGRKARDAYGDFDGELSTSV